MNILVTGAGGFIGKHVCDFLKQQGHSVVTVEISRRGNVKSDIAVDLSDDSVVKRVFKKFAKDNSIDVVIHLAAGMVNQEQNEEAQFNVLLDNIKITKNMVFIVKLLKPKKLINFSTMAVYPNTDGIFDEESKVMMSGNSECMYGLAKFCSENIFDFMLKKQSVSITHFRLAQVYGNGMRDDRVISMMKAELKKKNTITVFGFGQRTSNFIHIDKVLEILKCFIAKKNEGIYNVGHQALSYLGLAESIIKNQGNDKSRIIKLEQGSKAKFVLDTKRLEKAIKS